MSIDMDQSSRVYFFIYDPESAGEAVREDIRTFVQSNQPGGVQYRSAVGKVTATKLLRYATSYFLKLTSNGFVTFKIAITSDCNGTVTFKI